VNKIWTCFFKYKIISKYLYFKQYQENICCEKRTLSRFLLKRSIKNSFFIIRLLAAITVICNKAGKIKK
jgi:hypothetical protein